MLSRFPSPIAFGAALGFVDNALDRMSGRRDDEEFIAALRQTPMASTLLLAGDGVVVSHEGTVWHPMARVGMLGTSEQEAFLGCLDERAFFATALPAETADLLGGREDVAVKELRAMTAQALASNHDLSALATAKALMHWHRRHRFCSNCGTPTGSRGAGWRRECPQCGIQHFPRTDPVVIMLAVAGDHCLLGRSPRFPPGMYSCLAGYLEPGETLEDGVRREIMEESGVQTGYVTYLGSQPWPFPASVMLGCQVEATSTALTIDAAELEDARWFSREETRSLLDGSHPQGLKSPQPLAIAHHIMRAWVFADR